MMINNKQVVTRNGVTDPRKLDELILDMWENGWRGRPVIVADMGDYVQAFTGSHRLTAASVTGVAPDVVWLPSTLIEDDWEEIWSAKDGHELLMVFRELEYEYPGMVDVVAVMQQEIEANNQVE